MRITKDYLQETLQRSLARIAVPGASIAVYNNGEVITAAAGVANVNTGVAVTPETVMHIGSIAKIFTSTLIMQLVDEGMLDLDQLATRYLPELQLKDPESLQRITVKMLLNHTSGIDGEMLPDQGHDEETIEKAVMRFAHLGQIFPPGTEFSYCNAATVIAGYIAQRLRQKSWYTLVKDRIFKPLGMRHAVTLPEEALLYRAGVGHYLHPETQAPVPTSVVLLPLGFSPGGTTLMMSARDLMAFAIAHMRNGVGENGTRILSHDSARLMQQKTVDNKGKGYTYIDMGIGWLVADDGLITHSGGGPGIVSALYAYPERGFAAVILTNAEHGGGLINEFMAPWLEEMGSTRPLGIGNATIPANPVSVEPRKYVGIYEDVMTRYRVAQTQEGLSLSRQLKFANYDTASTEETPAEPLLPLGNDQFLLGSGAHAADAFRLFAFRNPSAEGLMQNIGHCVRLRKRVA